MIDTLTLEHNISNAERTADRLSYWLLFSIFLILVGLIVEYVPSIQELITKKEFNRKLLREVVGGILIIIGITFELGIQFFQFQAETALRSSHRQYEEALARENIETELNVMPRVMENPIAIVEKWKKYKGKTVRVASFMVDAEAASLARQIKASLYLAGVNTEDEIGKVSSVAWPWVGVMVDSAKINKEDMSLAFDLASTINEIGKVLAVPDWRSNDLPMKPSLLTNITIFVGPRSTFRP